MFHSFNPSLFGRPSGVLAETRALESSIAALRAVSVSLRELKDSARDDAGPVLADFAARLSVYFDAEEGGGYFETIAGGNSQLQSRVADLGDVHEKLRDSVSSARRKAHSSSDYDMANLGGHIDRIIDEFERHEDEERALLQEFFLREHRADRGRQ
jgi:hypothetical protein